MLGAEKEIKTIARKVERNREWSVHEGKGSVGLNVFQLFIWEYLIFVLAKITAISEQLDKFCRKARFEKMGHSDSPFS